MQVTLCVRAPKKPEKRVVVENDVVIGRGKNCNLQVLSNDVSRQHCRLVVGESGVAIRDLGSGNGTLINGQKTEPNVDAPLVSGDIVRIGPLVIKVDFLPSVSPVDMTPAEPSAAPATNAVDDAEVNAAPEPETVDAAPVAPEPVIKPVPAEDEMLEPIDDEPAAEDDGLIADEFPEAGPAELETAAVDETPEAEQRPKKKKSLFGMFGRKKNKAESTDSETQPVEAEVAAEPADEAQEPLLVDDNADVDQETVVFDQGNAYPSEDDVMDLLSDEEDLADEGDYLDEGDVDEEEAVDPGFADFLNQVDQPPS